MPMVTDPLFPLRIPTGDDGAHPSRGVAQQFSDFAWRVALLQLPQNVPMGSFNWVLAVPISLMQRFCCQFGFDFDSLCHTSIIHYSLGVHIIPFFRTIAPAKR